jgi:urea transporter, Yersinia type
MVDGNPWRRLAERHRGVEFVDACLRGAAQVMLQNNPLTGLLILIGIAAGAIHSGHPRVIVGVLVALVLGTLTAILLRADGRSVRAGLFGFSPLLTGAGVTTFLGNRPLTWVFLVIGAVATTVVTLALTTVVNSWGIPGLTFPFVLTTWFLLLGAYQFARATLAVPAAPALPVAGAPDPARLGGETGLDVLAGVSQVFLVDSWVAGLIILLGLIVNSRWSALFAAGGAVAGTLLAIGFGAGADAVGQGLWGFNAVLTAIALGAVLYRPSGPTAIYALIGVVVTVVVQAASTTVLAPLGVPTLTAPFVIATWLFLLPKRNFAPVPQHERHVDGLFAALRPDGGRTG